MDETRGKRAWPDTFAVRVETETEDEAYALWELSYRLSEGRLLRFPDTRSTVVWFAGDITHFVRVARKLAADIRRGSRDGTYNYRVYTAGVDQLVSAANEQNTERAMRKAAPVGMDDARTGVMGP